MGWSGYKTPPTLPSLFAYAPDGKTIAAPDGDHIKIWNLATEKLTRTLTVDSQALGSTWRFRACRLFAGRVHPDRVGGAEKRGEDQSILRLRRGQRTTPADFKRRDVCDFCFCGDKRTFAIVENNKSDCSQITIWDVTKGRRTGESAPVPESYLKSVAYLPRSNQLVTAEGLCTIRLWSLGGLETEVLPTKTETTAFQIAVSADGKVALALDNGFDVRNAETREIIAREDLVSHARSVALSPDGSLMAVGYLKGEVIVWDTVTWKRRYTFATGLGAEVRFSPDGKTLACLDSVLRIWDMQTGNRVGRMSGHEGPVGYLAFSPGGERLASTGQDRTLRIWNSKTGKQIRVQDLTGPTLFYPKKELAHKEVSGPRYPKNVAWSTDGATMAIDLQLHDAMNGNLIQSFHDEKSEGNWEMWPTNIALSSDGKITAVNGSEIRRWNLSSGTLLDRRAALRASAGKSVVAPDGSRIVSMGFEVNRPEVNLLVSDLAASRHVVALRIPQSPGRAYEIPEVYALAASPDSKRAAFGLFSIHVFDLADPLRSQSFSETPHAIGSLAFAPHGNAIAAGRDDGTVEFWDLSTHRQIAKFSTGQGLVTALAFSPDGRRIATGGADSTILFWPLRDLLAGDSSATDLTTFWTDLNQSDDIPRAYRAIERLAARPAESMPMLREKLKPRTPIPAERLAKLFAELDADDFGKRERATRDLQALGDVLRNDLVKLRKEAASAEVARRVSGILERFADRKPTEGFAVQTLEAIDNADAIRLLGELAGGVPGANLTLEAEAGVARRTRRLTAIQ